MKTKRLKRGTPTAERIENYIFYSPDGCWYWTGFINDGGYGMINVNRRPNIVHRLYYSLINGPIPKGKFVCHHCDNRRCVNPDHMFVGTTQDNVDDKVRKMRHNYGSKVPQSKLDPISIGIIREAQRKFKRGSQRKIAKYFNVSFATIGDIIKKRTWLSVQI